MSFVDDDEISISSLNSDVNEETLDKDLKKEIEVLETRQKRTGQDRRGEERTGQDKTGPDRTGQDRKGQDRT